VGEVTRKFQTLPPQRHLQRYQSGQRPLLGRLGFSMRTYVCACQPQRFLGGEIREHLGIHPGLRLKAHCTHVRRQPSVAISPNGPSSAPPLRITKGLDVSLNSCLRNIGAVGRPRPTGEQIRSVGGIPPGEPLPPESVKVRSRPGAERGAGAVSMLRAQRGNLRLKAGTQLEFRTQGP
jgi:hypothetical protein